MAARSFAARLRFKLALKNRSSMWLQTATPHFVLLCLVQRLNLACMPFGHLVCFLRVMSI